MLVAACAWGVCQSNNLKKKEKKSVCKRRTCTVLLQSVFGYSRNVLFSIVTIRIFGDFFFLILVWVKWNWLKSKWICEIILLHREKILYYFKIKRKIDDDIIGNNGKKWNRINLLLFLTFSGLFLLTRTVFTKLTHQVN